jgi:hypothetical protein
MLRRLLACAGFVLLLTSCSSKEQRVTINPPNEPLFPIVQNGKWGYMNARGEIIIPPRFKAAEEYSEDLAWADDTFIDGTGKAIINLRPLLEQQIAPDHKFIDGVVMLRDVQHTGFIRFMSLARLQTSTPSISDWATLNKQGQVWVPPYPLLQPFKGGLAPINLNGGVAFMNTSGEVVIPPGIYQSYSDCGEGLCAVSSALNSDHLWGFVDTHGQIAITPQYNGAHGFHEGLARASSLMLRKEIWGFINTSGHFVVPPEYDEADDFSDGYAAVKKNDRWGFVDRDGRTVVDRLYPDKPGRFHGGLAQVMLNGKLAYIDAHGHYVWTATD